MPVRPLRSIVPAAWIVLAAAAAVGAGESPRYRSPFDVAASPDGKTAYVSDRTAGVVAAVDLEKGKVERELALNGQPTGLAMTSDGGKLYVAEYGAGSVAEIDCRRWEIARRLPTGLRPMGLGLAHRRGRLIAANTTSDDVSIIDLESGKEVSRVAVPREPFFVAVSPDERLALAANLLPATSASDPASSASVTVIDLAAGRAIGDIRLPAGSTSVREMAIAPEGRRVYVAHTLGRFNLPTTQSERGWIYTNALSILDLESRQVELTLLLDSLSEGAANPWGVELAAGKLWVGLRGTHEVAALDLARLERLLAGDVPPELAVPAPVGLGTQNFWYELKRDPSRRKDLGDELGALYAAGVIRRYPAGGLGPRGLAATADGKRLLAACYHSGALTVLETSTGRVTATVPLGQSTVPLGQNTVKLGPEPDLVRRGEILFHDGTVSFQHWMSCSSCHPDEGRTDGLRWDLMNDGLGTPQNTRSLLWSPSTRPTTARGVRANYEVSVAAGFHFLGVEPAREDVEAVMAYLRSLEPEPSHHLAAGGRLGEAAARGSELFEGKAGCASCHSGAFRTDLKLHDVGSAGELDQPRERFVTPRLVELYRSAPFLHDGRARDLREIFERFNPLKRHGRWHELSPAEKDDLLAFLLSL